MRTSLLVVASSLLFCAAACGAGSGSDGRSEHEALRPDPGGGGSMLGANGKHFTAVRNQDGRLEVFASDSPGNAVNHIWQQPGGWSAWAPMNGALLSSPAVASNADGRLEAFGVGIDGAAYHAWQLTPNGSWSGWAGLGGVIISDIAVAANADGRLEIFGVGLDSGVYHQWQATPGGAWSGWAPMSGAVQSPPAVGRNADGRLEVFVIGEGGALFHAWQVTPNGGWSGWAPLGGIINGNLSVASNADGRLEVFALAGQTPFHIWQQAGGWSAWTPFPGQLTSDPVVARNADGRLELFGVGTDGALWHAWQVAPNAGWTSWFDSLGGVITNDPEIGVNADGRLEAFGRGNDGRAYHKWQAGGAWSDWVPLDASGGPPPPSCDPPPTTATMRFDMATFTSACASCADGDPKCFCQRELDHLEAGPSHVMLVGSGEHRCDIWAHGNHMAAYVNDMNADWTKADGPTAAQHILDALAKSFAPASIPQWIFLNEIYKDPGFWPDNPGYRGWVINLVEALHAAGHDIIVAAQMRDSLGSDESWAWSRLSQSAFLGLEWYINSDHWKAAPDPQQFLVTQYGNNKARYVAAGVNPSRLMFIEIYSTSSPGVTRGENGLPVSDWRTLIQQRLQAARTVGFAGYISYAWDYNQAGKSEAERLGDMDVYAGAF